mgnify:CR=1 FL=1
MSHSGATPPDAPLHATRSTSKRTVGDGTPAAATNQGDIIPLRTGILKFDQQLTEKSAEWAEVERDEKVEQDGREEIEELKKARQEIDRKIKEKQRVVDSAINRIENNSEKMEVLKKSWGEEF